MKRKLTALLLVLALLCTLVTPVMAGNDWWKDLVSAPSADWSISDGGVVETTGTSVLFTSDCHRYTYLVKDLLKAANDVEPVGLISFGGDFANEKVLYDDNMTILKAAIGETPATYTKGNHEGDVTDEAFEAAVGMSRIGETAVNTDGNYYFFNFGAFNGTTQFLTEDIEALDTYLSTHTDKPCFIVSHYPIHYYNDRRSSKNAKEMVECLNKYPNAIFLWGHNHTEQDPNYGMIRYPGDVIQTGATADTTVEINFIYGCLGALRDGVNGANGLLATVSGTDVTFRYIYIDAKTTGETWTDAQGNENAIREATKSEVSSTTELSTAPDLHTITLANVQIDRPLAAQEPATMVSEYSPRFTASDVTWTPAAGAFAFDTAYTAAFTLTAEEGYAFASDAVVSVNKEYVGPMPGQKNHTATVTVSEDGKTAQVSYTFDATVAQAAEPYALATSLLSGHNYVVASSQNYAASYAYDPAQHGEESMPDYAVTPADVVVQDGQLLSEADPYTVFTAQEDVNGYLLWSDASLKAGLGATTLNYLSMSTRGGDLGLEAAETAGNIIYNNWNVTESGVPYLDVDGALKYLTFDGGKFCYTDNAQDSNVRLYEVGQADGTIYNAPVTVTAPVAGATASAEAHSTAGNGTAVWDAETFDYNTAYTVTVTLTPYGLVDETALTARVNGNTADVEVVDGKIVVTYTFDPTGAKPGAETSMVAKATNSIVSGSHYVIAAGNKAMTINPDGIYQGSANLDLADGKITAPITGDMIFCLTGNDQDGYTLKNGDLYLAGRSVDNSPDLWGFTTTTNASKAVTFAYKGGKLEVVSTGSSGGGAGGPGGPGGGPGGPGGGAGAPPPPPGGNSTSYLYENNGHFNFSSYNSSDITLYKLELPFTDLDEGWSHKYIYNASLLGLMEGNSATKFDPEMSMTRCMAITVLYRLAGSPAVTGKSSFTDLHTDGYYLDALLWGEQNGIVNGTGNHKFQPNLNITREMFATMISRFMKLQGIEPDGESITFTDMDKALEYAKPHIEACAKAGIITGYPNGTFQPQNEIRRCEAAAMLVRLNDLLG